MNGTPHVHITNPQHQSVKVMDYENLLGGVLHLVTHLHDQEILLQDSEPDCDPGEIDSFVVYCCDGQGQENDFPKNGFLTFSLAHHSIHFYCGSEHV